MACRTFVSLLRSIPLSPHASRSLSLAGASPLLRLRPLVAAVPVGSSLRLSPVRSVFRCFSTRPTTSSLNDPSPNWSNRPPKETILLDGCDFEHWLVVVEPPDPSLTRDEIIASYIKILGEVLGSEEEARQSIYSVSTKHYFAFGCKVSEEISYKIKPLQNVRWVLPDSYLDVRNKDYGGEPFIDGNAVPYDPKYHEEWVRNNARAQERSRRNDRPRNFDRSRNFERRRENMQNFQSREAGPVQNQEFQNTSSHNTTQLTSQAPPPVRDGVIPNFPNQPPVRDGATPNFQNQPPPPTNYQNQPPTPTNYHNQPPLPTNYQNQPPTPPNYQNQMPPNTSAIPNYQNQTPSNSTAVPNQQGGYVPNYQGGPRGYQGGPGGPGYQGDQGYQSGFPRSNIPGSGFGSNESSPGYPGDNITGPPTGSRPGYPRGNPAGPPNGYQVNPGGYQGGSPNGYKGGGSPATAYPGGYQGGAPAYQGGNPSGHQGFNQPFQGQGVASGYQPPNSRYQGGNQNDQEGGGGYEGGAPVYPVRDLPGRDQ